jgi:PqqD family protein of HPr-rel-A system
VEAVTASSHDRGLVLFHRRHGHLFTANHVGTRIWEGLEQRLPLDAIVATLSREYNMHPGAIRDDVQRFLGQLQAQGLVEPRSQR